MARGLRAAGDCDYVLFTDADIGYAPDALATLVRGAVADDRALVSQMALLRAESGWERVIVPAFVYFFAQLYPFRRVNRPSARTAAAAGGCMLVRRDTLIAAGGLDPIRGARIDDVALGRLLKRPPSAARIWLGFSTGVRSLRPYPRLATLWDMIARSAYTQLRYSPGLLAADPGRPAVAVRAAAGGRGGRAGQRGRRRGRRRGLDRGGRAGRVGRDERQLPARAAAVPARLVAGAPAAPRGGALRRDDRRFRPAALRRTGRRMEGADRGPAARAERNKSPLRPFN